MTYILHDAQFKNFSHIICVWPECCKKMVDDKVSDDEMVSFNHT
jgi:pyoverdine/dityrosine biosynthesis protein Dit1